MICVFPQSDLKQLSVVTLMQLFRCFAGVTTCLFVTEQFKQFIGMRLFMYCMACDSVASPSRIMFASKQEPMRVIRATWFYYRNTDDVLCPFAEGK